MRCSMVEVIYSFGRHDQLDVEAIKRLVDSLCRFISPEDALRIQGETNSCLSFISSKLAGGVHLL